jgi:hypothetical protein
LITLQRFPFSQIKESEARQELRQDPEVICLNLMNIPELTQLFPDLPPHFLSGLSRHPDSGLFKTCWYGSAGGDLRLVDYFRPEHSLVGAPVSVFFFTDIGYALADKRIGWNGNHDLFHPDFSDRHESSLLLKGGTVAPVIISSARGRNALYIHIQADDALFESTLIESKVKMDIVAYFNGMNAGPGPVDLVGLRADFSFGEPRCHRTEWSEGMRWAPQPFGFEAAEGFLLIPLSKRCLKGEEGERDAEFCRIVRLPAHLGLDLNVEYTNQLKACSGYELSQESIQKRMAQIREDLANVDTTGFEDLL